MGNNTAAHNLGSIFLRWFITAIYIVASGSSVLLFTYSLFWISIAPMYDGGRMLLYVIAYSVANLAFLAALFLLAALKTRRKYMYRPQVWMFVVLILLTIWYATRILAWILPSYM